MREEILKAKAKIANQIISDFDNVYAENNNLGQDSKLNKEEAIRAIKLGIHVGAFKKTPESNGKYAFSDFTIEDVHAFYDHNKEYLPIIISPKYKDVISVKDLLKIIRGRMERGKDMENNTNDLNENVKAETEQSKKWAYIQLPNGFINKRETKQGREFYSCTIPSGVNIDGKNLGGYKFTSNFCNDPIVDWDTRETDPAAKYKSLGVLNKPIKLSKVEQDETTGEWKEIDTIEVEPRILKQALYDSYKEYKKSRLPEQELEKTTPKKSHAR